MSDEQWKNGGDCQKCRRRNYCGTSCKKHKDKVERTIGGMVAKAMVDTWRK